MNNISMNEILTWIHAPVFTLHRLQMRDQRLGGMWDTLVMGSILSGQAMLTCRGVTLTAWWAVIQNKLYMQDRRCTWLMIYLWYPQSAAHMCPLGACSRGLHGAALQGTQEALRVDAEDTRPAQPVSNRHFDDTIAGLRDTRWLMLYLNWVHVTGTLACRRQEIMIRNKGK